VLQNARISLMGLALCAAAFESPSGDGMPCRSGALDRRNFLPARKAFAGRAAFSGGSFAQSAQLCKIGLDEIAGFWNFVAKGSRAERICRGAGRPHFA